MKWSSSTLTTPSCHSARRAWPELQNPKSHLAKDKLLSGEKMPVWADERWGKALFPVTHTPSATVTPTSGGRGLITRTWILRLRLRLRAEWQGGRHTAKSDSFRTMKTNRKEIWCRIDWLGWCCVHRFWIDPVPIVFGMMLWELVLEWSFSYWLLIDVCIGFGLMLCSWP